MISPSLGSGLDRATAPAPGPLIEGKTYLLSPTQANLPPALPPIIEGTRDPPNLRPTSVTSTRPPALPPIIEGTQDSIP